MLVKRIRLYIYIVTSIVVAAVFIWLSSTVATPDLRYLRLTQVYGFISLFYILAGLYISPIYSIFPLLPGKAIAILSRRAIGVSAFVFALLHSSIAFFYILGGVQGLGYLSQSFLISISIGLANLIILTALALTSFDFAVVKMGKWWKRLHWFVYILSASVLLHATIIGTHFQTLEGSISGLLYLLTYIWFILESLRLDKFINKRLKINQQWGIATVSSVVISIILIFVIPNILSSGNTLSIHSSHGSGQVSSGLYNDLDNSIKTKIGNPNINFHAVMDSGQDLKPNLPISFNFKIINDTLGQQVDDPSAINQQRINLFVVDNGLENSSILVPEFKDGKYWFKPVFAVDDIYHLHLRYLPLEGTEQFFDYTVSVGTPSKISQPSQSLDRSQTKKSGNFEVSMTSSNGLDSKNLSIGNSVLDFKITQNNQDVKTQKPAILSIVNLQSFQFVHSVPSDGVSLSQFRTYAIKNKIIPGVYKIFITFFPENTDSITTVLTIKID